MLILNIKIFNWYLDLFKKIILVILYYNIERIVFLKDERRFFLMSFSKYSYFLVFGFSFDVFRSLWVFFGVLC